MTSSASLSGTGYALLALQHRSRTSAAPAKIADTNINATGQRSHGGGLSIGLDSTGNVLTKSSAGKDGKTVKSAAVDLFG
ncbi:hypothetical protein LWC05_00230 [Acetobacter sicerae]|uniref:Transposase n=1 Tax=Acetobacter sicerae TaxID=85325 RepID=A0ABS8VUY6_9PROT|nr:hypothetical protein [Acetobacter sicerae]MCE0742326.1 hypothetical protein [Acetobacter sicerae]NHN92349.1 hypothetical protein [Acetobacter sicerae]